MLIIKNELDEFGTLADQFIINSDHESLAALGERFTKHDFEFPHPLYEAHYLYCLGIRYFMYQSFEPLGLISRYSPALSPSLKGLSVGLNLRIAVSVSAIAGGSIR